MAAPKKKAMGKGLAALLKDPGELNSAPENTQAKIVGNIAELPIEQIDVNKDQPRTAFDEEALQELASSIAQIGIIQPITVRVLPEGRYQIISGERRFRASKMAGLERIPAYIRLADDQAMLEMALVENIQREELDAIEIALSYQRLIEECALTQEAMSERVGKKRSTITNYLRLLKLQPLIQAGLRDKMISMGHARALVNVEDEELQLELYQQTIAKAYSVRQIEEAVRKAKNPPAEKKKERPSLPEEWEELRDGLAEKLETDIQLKKGRGGRGSLVISFSNERELKRLSRLLQS